MDSTYVVLKLEATTVQGQTNGKSTSFQNRIEPRSSFL
jgi:hypothetical protein